MAISPQARHASVGAKASQGSADLLGVATIVNRGGAARGGRRRKVATGVGKHRIDVDELAMAGPDELMAKLKATFASPDYRPPVLPAIAFELTELSRRPDVGFDDATALLERDPMLASEVLRTAQSPMYAARIPVQSVGEAVRRLGLRTLRDIVWQVVVNMRIFRTQGYEAPMRDLQRHATAIAHFAKLVCQRTTMGAEYAFLCGLLHDVGISGTLITIAEGRRNPPDISILWPTIDQMHAYASGQMTRLWGLDEEIQNICRSHHNFDSRKLPHPIVAAISVAEEIAHDLGLGPAPDRAAGSLHVSQVDMNTARQQEDARTMLDIDDSAFLLLVDEAEKIAASLP